MKDPDTPLPRLSIILPGDRWETIRRMADALCRQTVRQPLEVVVVCWPGAWRDGSGLEDAGFAAIRPVHVAAGTPLPAARAAGARAATAPLVFFSETHAYPRPEWAEAVLEAAASRWDVVSSAFANANPDGLVSWAGFISDYGAFADDLPAGEIAMAPIHKGAFPRDALLAFGDRLAAVLSSGDELPHALKERGLRAYFEPRARIDHRNIPSFPLWLRGRFLIGFLIGVNRAERWSRLRRASYAVAAPLIGVVLTLRTLPIARRIGRESSLPAGVSGAILAGAFARAAGEALGYALGKEPRLQARADEYELVESVYAGLPA